jgi:hypothetical protein
MFQLCRQRFLSITITMSHACLEIGLADYTRPIIALSNRMSMTPSWKQPKVAIPHIGILSKRKEC